MSSVEERDEVQTDSKPQPHQRLAVGPADVEPEEGRYQSNSIAVSWGEEQPFTGLWRTAFNQGPDS